MTYHTPHYVLRCILTQKHIAPAGARVEGQVRRVPVRGGGAAADEGAGGDRETSSGHTKEGGGEREKGTGQTETRGEKVSIELSVTVDRFGPVPACQVLFRYYVHWRVEYTSACYVNGFNEPK